MKTSQMIMFAKAAISQNMEYHTRSYIYKVDEFDAKFGGKAKCARLYNDGHIDYQCEIETVTMIPLMEKLFLNIEKNGAHSWKVYVDTIEIGTIVTTDPDDYPDSSRYECRSKFESNDFQRGWGGAVRYLFEQFIRNIGK